MANRKGAETRERIFEILRASNGAMGAYAILEEMRAPNRRVAPTTVYRALAALVEQGKVHRIESANAYVACSHPHQDHANGTPVLSICDDCGSVEEHAAPDLFKTVQQRVEHDGFVPAQSVIEVRGHCASCHETV